MTRPATFEPAGEATDNCDVTVVVLTRFRCWKKNGKPSKACKVESDGSQASVYITGGVGSRIASDSSGNTATETCSVDIVSRVS